MKIKTVTWNIGGAKTLEPGADPELMASYNVDAIDYIVDKLSILEPDVIAFQEIQKNDVYDQAEIIATKLGYKYFIHQSFSWSHNEDDAQLGNAIISKYPISQPKSGKFINPGVTVTWEDGRTVETHDKGYIQGVIEVNGKRILLSTLHLTPFRKFGMEYTDPKAVEILSDVSRKLTQTRIDYSLVLGDFNIDNQTVSEFLPGLTDNGFEEVPSDEATTPKGRKYDHVLYKGLRMFSKGIDSSVLTDHYLLTTDFDI